MKKLICRLMRYIADIVDEILTWCHISIAAPTLLTATVVPPDIVLAWTDNATNNTCYMIWRSTDGTNFTLLVTINTADLSTWTDTTAVFGQTYWYRVQACDANGNTSDFSNTVESSYSATGINYGLLYNWYAATGDGGAHNIAPAGWHVPTPDEFEILSLFLDPLGTTPTNNVAGADLKEIGLIYWDSPNTGATNSSGFNARGSGRRNYSTGAFEFIKRRNELWSSVQQDATYGRTAYLAYDDDYFASHIGAYQVYLNKKYGCSIRLIKDNAINPGSLTDYDNNIYTTVTIGTQVWMASNLAVTHYNDGTPIPEVTDAGAWAALATGALCYYDNDPNNM